MDPWRFNTVHSNSQLWLSNGNDVHSIQQDASTRLIVDQGGFLDITTAGTRMLDANGLWLWDDDDKNTSSLLELNLWVYDSTFTLAIDKMRGMVLALGLFSYNSSLERRWALPNARYERVRSAQAITAYFCG